MTTHATPRTTTRTARILVVDDERSMRELLSIVLKREGYDVLVAENGGQAIDLLERETLDLLITDIRMPDMSGVEVLRAAKRLHPDIVGIMMTAFASTETAVEAMRLGAVDYLTKPFNMDTLRFKVVEKLDTKRLQIENVLLKRALEEKHQFGNLIGRSEAMRVVFRLIETVAPTGSTILITGESGTGKELVAKAIHFNSPRREHPFVVINCGALPESLLESELFGHTRGAFTGATANKKGLIEVASQGTIFLDEIGEMSPAMQVKLLRVLQERRFRPVGSTGEIEADVRVITATHRDLAGMVADGGFREDLFYRINVIPVPLPPLRARRDDVSLLAERFVERFTREMGRPIRGLSSEALDCLEHYGWPGNVRELENVIERAIALEQTDVIHPDSLPEEVRRSGSDAPPPEAGDAAAGAAGALVRHDALPAEGFDLEGHVQEIEREYIAEALRRAGGVKVRAAELLGMSFRSLRYYAKKYNLQ